MVYRPLLFLDIPGLKISGTKLPVKYIIRKGRFKQNDTGFKILAHYHGAFLKDFRVGAWYMVCIIPSARV